MRSGLSELAGAAGLGGGLMYLLDPDLGRRRRALLRDQLVHLAHQASGAEHATIEDVRHRAFGLVAEVRALPSRDGVDDEVLVERVRSRMGHLIRYPHAIHVTSDNGTVTLRGPILAEDVGWLKAGVCAVPGVRDVIDRLDVHQHPGSTPGLPGSTQRRGRSGIWRENWPPAQRLFLGTCGALLLIEGLDRRGMFGYAMGAIGLVPLARALTNRSMSRLLGAANGRRASHVRRTIHRAEASAIASAGPDVQDAPEHVERPSRRLALE